MKNHTLHSSGKFFSRLTLLLSLLLLSLTTAFAQPPPAENGAFPAAAPAPAPTPVPAQDTVQKKPFEIFAITIVKYRNQKFNRCTKPEEISPKEKYNDYFVYPGDYISVKIPDTNMKLAYKMQDSIRLWINGLCYPNLKPIYFDHNSSSLIFNLTIDTAANSPWKLFYHSPNYWHLYHNVNVSLGTLTREFKGPTCPRINLYTSGLLTIFLGYAIFLALILLILKYAKGMLRDVDQYVRNGVVISYKRSQPTSSATGTINVLDLPYSLSRFQFMVWLIIIFFSIIHIYVIKDTLPTPTDNVLLLLGISGGTFFLGRLIDTKPNVTTDEQNPTAAVADFIANSKTKGFWFDLLYDSKTLSLHRLQLMMFTLFLGFYFLSCVIYYLTMPEFSTNMMMLMGISSGTYAGIKTIEKKSGGTPAANPSPMAPVAPADPVV